MDLKYWAQYEISLDELKLNNVYSIDYSYINHKLISYFDKIRYAYYIHPKYFKLYTPLSKDNKWLSNCPIDVPFNIDTPRISDTLIVTKSLKDKMVLSKIYTDVVAVQNESLNAVQGVIELSKEYKDIIIFFDNDEPGIKAAEDVKNELGWNNIMIPREFIETDPSDFVKTYSMKELRQLLHYENYIF